MGGRTMRACQPVADGYVERDGVKVHYELFGAGEPTVLLLPTWSIIHSRHWKMQIPYLARHCRVVTFDGRGNGRSDRPTEPAAYAESEFAADALAVMDATQTPRAVIVGFSMGAQRGLLLAANHPERVQAAVFIGGSYPGGGEPLPERTVYSWEEELDTDEGWAKHNHHYWLRDGLPRLLHVEDVHRAALHQADRGHRRLGSRHDRPDARAHLLGAVHGT
jgi:pimeloyl-ACP methyl ester carboxylesterase